MPEWHVSHGSVSWLLANMVSAANLLHEGVVGRVGIAKANLVVVFCALGIASTRPWKISRCVSDQPGTDADWISCEGRTCYTHGFEVVTAGYSWLQFLLDCGWAITGSTLFAAWVAV